MTPQELHSRILLHEIRTILLDETRQGDQIPQEWRKALTETPHETTPYLVLADTLDEQGNPLGELVRIQVELIEEMPFDGLFHLRLGQTYEINPFQADYLAASPASTATASRPQKLLASRWELAKPLYPEREYALSHDEILHYGSIYLLTHSKLRSVLEGRLKNCGFDLDRPYQSREDTEHRQHIFTQSPKLGRTTRLLTDALRYCALHQGQGKHILIQHPNPTTLRTALELLGQELLAYPFDWYAAEAINYLWENHVHIGLQSQIVVWASPKHYSMTTPDLTLTDHACQQEDQQRQNVLDVLRLSFQHDNQPQFSPAIIRPDTTRE